MDIKEISPKFIMALCFTGVIAGLVGIGFTLLLHVVQQLVFYGGLIETPLTFRELVENTSTFRRFWALVFCGIVVGLGWVALHRYAKPIMEVKVAIAQPEKNMPVFSMVCHTFLQIITVGMGSPLGREVAPRELSVALATPLSQRLNLSLQQKSILLACASGAGLAAVYNVPLAATVFILETLLMTWSVSLIAIALLTCGIAVIVVRIGLGDIVQYGNIIPLVQAKVDTPLLVWSLLAGILIAFSVHFLQWCDKKLPKFDKTSWTMLPLSIFAFSLIGLMSIQYPDILGNGKAGNQLSFANDLAWQTALGLLITKWLAVLLASVAVAYGGRITPSMMLGGLIAFISAIIWNISLPEIHAGMAAFIGATVFLGLAQNMRLTAIIFMLELSRLSTADWLPVCLCMSVALFIEMILKTKKHLFTLPINLK